eukprot:gene35111-45449_t
MSQVIRNLVSNALKFSPKGSSVVITTEYITDRIIDKDGSNRSNEKIKLLRIQVKDHGAGIAKNSRKQPFVPILIEEVDRKRRRVLVVDDATTNRKFLCRLLKDKYDVEDAEDGHIAVTTVRNAMESD